MIRSLSLALLGALLCLPACGRSPASKGGDPSPSADLGTADMGADLFILDSASVDGPLPDRGGPCTRGCVESCKLVTSCGLFPAGPYACLNACPSWKAATRQCFDNLVCSPAPSCEATRSCIVEPPPLPDLSFKSPSLKVTGQTVDIAFEVCNTGKGDAPVGFAIELFWDSPKPGAPADWVMMIPPGLPAGSCGPASARRVNTPEGDYQLWVQLDPGKAVVESDEKNNVLGPVPVKVTVPKVVDLWVKRFDASVSGGGIDYEVEVCNKGNGDAWVFRVDLFYNSSFTPFGILGDHSFNLFGGLGAGKCRVLKHRYANAAVRQYRSWIKVDALNAVAEGDEGNNNAGPKVVSVSAASGCSTFCSFASGCGLFGFGQTNRCLTWCNGFDAGERSCAYAATTCNQLKACTLPPLPPGPLPLTACLTVCNHLVNQCQLLPSDQRLTCIAGCQTLPESKRRCAYDAQQQGQCAQMMVCLF